MTINTYSCFFLIVVIVRESHLFDTLIGSSFHPYQLETFSFYVCYRLFFHDDLVWQYFVLLLFKIRVMRYCRFQFFMLLIKLYFFFYNVLIHKSDTLKGQNFAFNWGQRNDNAFFVICVYSRLFLVFSMQCSRKLKNNKMEDKRLVVQEDALFHKQQTVLRNQYIFCCC